MKFIPAYCNNCKILFRSAYTSMFGNAARLNMQGNLESCPKCNQMARTADGLFNLTNDMVEVISAPAVTFEMVSALKEFAAQSLHDKAEDNKIIAGLESINPDVANLVKQGVSGGINLRFLLVMLLFMSVSSCEHTLDWNQLWDQVTNTDPEQIISENISQGDEATGKPDTTAKDSTKKSDNDLISL